MNFPVCCHLTALCQIILSRSLGLQTGADIDFKTGRETRLYP